MDKERALLKVGPRLPILPENRITGSLGGHPQSCQFDLSGLLSSVCPSPMPHNSGSQYSFPQSHRVQAWLVNPGRQVIDMVR